MKDSSQQGSAIIMLFVAVALFGMLAYAFLQGSRNNLSMVTKEADKTVGYQSQDCTNAIKIAVQRLQNRGCGTRISYAQDGTNIIAGAPADGSCSVFHTNGGGVKSCIQACPPSQMLTLTAGKTCGSLIYAGLSGGNRIYASSNDAGMYSWNNGTTNYLNSGATSVSDGRTNTTTVLALTDRASPHQAMTLCKGMGTDWFLPSRDELTLLQGVRHTGDFEGTFSEGGYWSSTQTANNTASIVTFSSAAVSSVLKNLVYKVRCVRRD